jgi:surfeit locus 1 family protein
MRRSALIPALAAILVTAVTARLGFWQLDRAAQKEVLQSRYERMRAQPPLDLAHERADLAKHRYRRAQVRGTFEPQHQILLDNQVHEARAGYHVLEVLRIEGSGERLIVDRGWVERTREYPAVPKVQSDLQSITVTGIIDSADRKLIELSSETIQGKLWQNFTAERFRAQTGIAILPFMLVQQDAPTHGLTRVNIEPNFNIERHYGYAFQWFALAATTIVLYVVHTVRRKRQTRQS